MKIQIKNRFTNEVIIDDDYVDLREAIEKNRANLSEADLSNANLSLKGKPFQRRPFRGRPLQRKPFRGRPLQGKNKNHPKR